MIYATHGRDNTPHVETTTTQASVSTTITRHSHSDPPPVLIGLREVAQMRRKKQMLADLAEWESRRQAEMSTMVDNSQTARLTPIGVIPGQTAGLLPMGNEPGQSAGMTAGGCGR